MDKLSGLASKLGGNKSSSSGSGHNSGHSSGLSSGLSSGHGSSHGSGHGSNSGSHGQEDYVDKALDSVERKAGGGKIDPAKMRSTNEKITDTGREHFEKSTGTKVPSKISN